MNISEIKGLVAAGLYVYSIHAEIERKMDELSFEEIEMALLSGKILEDYFDTGRGESCLIIGFAHNIPIHIVCGWRGNKICVIIAYVPKPPKFITPWKRGI